MEVRRICVERRCEKDPLKKKRLSIALHRARQSMRRNQTDLSFKKAVEAGAPSRLQGPPPPTRAPIVEKLGLDGTTERVEDLQGQTDIVHKHFMELFTDPLHKETPEWIRQRWPNEVLQSLPTIDGQRVREAAYAGRRHVGNTRKLFPFQTAESLDGGSGHAVGKTAGYDGQEKERQTRSQRCTSCTQKCCNGWQVRQSTCPQCGHVPGRQAQEVVFTLRCMVDQAQPAKSLRTFALHERFRFQSTSRPTVSTT